MPNDFYKWIISMAIQEGGVCISPHPDPFRPKERAFLDGIRNVPASINAPPGRNPFDMAMGKRGRWIFIWVPE